MSYIFDVLMLLVIVSLVAIVALIENRNAKIRVGRKVTTIRDFIFPPLLPVHMSPPLTVMPLRSVSVDEPPYMRV